MRWLPAHETHAIERVNLTFQFAEPLPAKPFQALLNAASLEFPKLGFNTTVDEHEFIGATQMLPMVGGPGGGLQIQLGGIAGLGATPAGQMPQVAVAGRSFQVIADNQMREEVSVNRSRFTYSSLLYNGWAAHRARFMTLLAPYLDRMLPLTNLQIVKMEYWDRFVFAGPPADAAYGELLKPGSRFLPGFPADSRELWHSHIGFFMPAPPRRLINLNVDVVDLIDATSEDRPPGAPALKRSVGLYTMAQDTLLPEVSPSNAEGTISTLEALHTILKDALSAVITAEAADRVSLNARTPS